MPYALAVHGGAGLIRPASLTPDREAACRAGLERALEAGEQVLAAGGSALDAVTAAVVALEDDPVFNAGRGAVLAADGSVELDAAVMCGHDRSAGAVASVRTAKNPVLLARAVRERTPHVLLVGVGADQLASEVGLPVVPRAWFVTAEREAQLARTLAGADAAPRPDVYGTVGAVAVDLHGHVAAATSTGGTVGKRPGRVGDTPILGAGTFAWDRTAAISGTGHGEPFLRLGVAHRVSAWMELGGLDLQAATDRVIQHELGELSGRGGLIAVDAAGNVAMPFNTAGMFRGSVQQGGRRTTAIW